MSLKLNLRKDELIAISKEMCLMVPDKAKVVDLIESSDVYKDDIEFVRNLIDSILEEKRKKSVMDKREYEIAKIKLAQLEKQLEIVNARRNLANTSQTTEI
ncbi:hypothetical protein AVEN_264594-1, partial [Araneus ventricosus]